MVGASNWLGDIFIGYLQIPLPANDLGKYVTAAEDGYIFTAQTLIYKLKIVISVLSYKKLSYQCYECDKSLNFFDS